MAIKRRKKKYPYKGEEFASKAERTFAIGLINSRIVWMYEPEKFEWMPPPAKKRKYTPDFKIIRKDGSYFFVEFKGFFRPTDQIKMRAMKTQHPEIDIRFVFMDSKKFISKRVRKDGSRMTYADWANKYKYQYADLEIPEAWLNETEI